MSHAPRTHSRDPLVAGFILVAIGLGALVMNLAPDMGNWIVLLIGLTLLGVFLFTREYGALVPGGIMTGLGAGILASTRSTLGGEDAGGVIVLGLGLGFVSIWLLSLLFRIEENHPWPLIPGGILTAVGAALLVGGEAVELLRFWPVVLIAVGIVAIGRAVMDRTDT